MLRFVDRRLKAAALLASGLLSLSGCFDGGVTVGWPVPPAGAQSAIFVRECGAEKTVEAFDLPGQPQVLIERCVGTWTHWLAFYPNTLAELRITPGLQDPAGCPALTKGCCRSEAIPDPAKDGLYYAPLSEGISALVRYEGGDSEGWPSGLDTLVVGRGCDCPTEPVRVTLTRLDASRIVRVAHLTGEELLVLASSHYVSGQRARCELYHTDLAELRRSTVLRDAFATFEGFDCASLAAFADGRYFIGLGGGEGRVLTGTVGAAPVAIEHPDGAAVPLRETQSLALRPGSEAEPEIATVGRYRAAEFETYRGGQWVEHGDADAMRGTCTDPFNRDQGSGIGWLNEEELYVLPPALPRNMQQLEPRVSQPDGLWRLKGGELTWLNVPHDPEDCLRSLVLSSEHGPHVSTYGANVFALREDGWRQVLSVADLAPFPFESFLRALLPVEGGLLYARGDGVLGLYVDPNRCFEQVVANIRFAQILRVGPVFVASGDAVDAQRSGGIAIIEL